jgi:RHS repeat-associated protein
MAWTRTTYGAYGLPCLITHPDGTTTRIAYNPLFSWHDGSIYLQKVTTDARGVVTEELIDANDEVRQTITRDPFGTEISHRTVTFSTLGKPTLIEDQQISSGTSQAVIQTRFTYDIAGQVTACTFGDGTPDQASWVYRYDAEGRKIEETKPSGITLFSSYDAKGRLSSCTSSDGTIAWKYQYNNQDLPERIENEITHAATIRRYNGLGLLTEESLENGLSLSYGVTSTGLLSSITYPDGSASSYTYTSGRLSSIERNDYIYRVTTRDLSGMITEASLPGGAGKLSQSIDGMGRKTAIHHEAFDEQRTVFDPVGCCLERIIDGTHEVFSYDYLCQLTNDNGRASVYDSLHHRIEHQGETATHNARHQMLSQGGASFRYDRDGRRVADDTYVYSYDACDRLTAIETASSRYEYAYDPFNRRMSSTTSIKENDTWKQVSSERYLWLQDNEIGAVDKDSHLQSLRLLGEGFGGEIGAAVAFEIKGELFIPIHDLSGHVRACVNSHGEIAEKLSYTAFGLESRTGQITPWTFSSKRQDEATGFVYFGRRYYDPKTATWLTQDPLGHTAGPNLYAYVKNNPLTCIDLYGLEDTPNGDRGFFGGIWDSICNAFGSNTASDSNEVVTSESDANPHALKLTLRSFCIHHF